MIEIWEDATKTAWPRWRSYGDGPIVVCRPMLPRLGRNPLAYPQPDDSAWVIAHRRTGRVLPVPALFTGDRMLMMHLVSSLLAVAPTRIWRDMRDAKSGDPFTLPPELMDEARALMEANILHSKPDLVRDIATRIESITARLATFDKAKLRAADIAKLIAVKDHLLRIQGELS